ncbi:MAG: hypothetical protein KQJ78_16595 [Deltaproteobacteria bacterium]|nr:hypothetical protein [Deltaproteobacteria bacterium]
MALSLKPAAPPQPGPPSAGGGGKARPPVRLSRAVLPLILLILPAGLWAATLWTPDTWDYWLQLTALVLAAVILAWVFFRMARYFTQQMVKRRQQAFIKRQDPLYIAGRRVEARIRDVVNRLDEAGLGPYGLPWYAVLADSPGEVDRLLKGSGLSFPAGVAEGLNSSDDQPDRWFLASEAVLLDTSGLGLNQRNSREWELIFHKLAKRRAFLPLNGAIVVVNVDLLAGADPEAKEAKYAAILERLRAMQAAMRLNFPVYLVVDGLDRVAGFREFFAYLDENQREQILGWSDPRGGQAEFNQKFFRQGLIEMNQTLNAIMMRRLVGSLPAESAGRIFFFVEEFKDLLGRIKDLVETVFTPNRYLEALPFRGFYLTGLAGQGPPVTFRPEAVAAGFSGGLGAGTGFLDAKASFGRELFQSKILAETGMATRTRRALRRDYVIKTACAAMVLGVLGWGVYWVNRTVVNTGREMANLSPTLILAEESLRGSQGALDPLALGGRLTSLKIGLGEVPWYTYMGRMFRNDVMKHYLGQIHRAVYQELFLRYYLLQLQNALAIWAGEGNFDAYGQSLVEYTRWANPTRTTHDDLVIEPFTNFLGGTDQERQSIITQFEEYQKEGGPSGRVVSADAGVMLERALNELKQYLNPSLSGRKRGNLARNDSAWWVGFTQGMEKLDQEYQSLLSRRAPGTSDTFEEVLARYDNLVTTLATFLGQLDSQAQLMDQASQAQASWISADKFFASLNEASRGWTQVQQVVASCQEVAHTYQQRVAAPLERRLHLVQLLAGRSGYGWLAEQLGRSFPQQASVVLDPSYMVGPSVAALLADVGDYHNQIQSWSDNFATWKEDLKVYTHLASQTGPLLNGEQTLLNSEDKVNQGLRDLERLAGADQSDQPGGSGGASAAAGAAAGQAAAKAGGAAKGAGGLVQDLTAHLGGSQKSSSAAIQGVLSLYSWPVLQEETKGWLDAFRRIRLYQTSLYWQELARRFTYAQDLLDLKNWNSLKQASLFSLGDGEALVAPVSDFLREWQRSLPQDLLSALNGGGSGGAAASKAPPRELADFADLNQNLMQFKDTYLATMRKASDQFVRCVHDMYLDPAQAWNQIWSTQGPGGSGSRTVFWGALEALNQFQDSYENQTGPVLIQITGPAVAVENNVSSAFQQALLGVFQKRWDALLSRYEQAGYPQNFPFTASAEGEVPRDGLMTFLSELNTLSQSFALTDQPAAGSQAGGAAASQTPGPDIYPLASKIRGSMATPSRVRFLNQTAAFQSFLEGRNLKEPRTVTVSLTPGQIGRYVHWVRLMLGNGAYYDLNVYGKPAEKIVLNQPEQSVTLQGLDVNLNPLNSLDVTRGDFALLHMVYAWGATQDPKRQKWVVDAALPSADEPGKMIPFQMVLTFSESLPQLPRWPSE